MKKSEKIALRKLIIKYVKLHGGKNPVEHSRFLAYEIAA
jgi:hypothetical protein